MKTRIYTGLILIAAIVGAACQSASNDNANLAANGGAAAGGGNMAMTNQNSAPVVPETTTLANSDPKAAGQQFDLQFIDTMSQHHQLAINMAQTALTKADSDELKTFARKIVDDQTKEIAQMREWRGKWYAGKPAAMNMDMPGMRDSMKIMSVDEMRKIEAASGKDFDSMFLDMMTPHHEGAVLMAKEALQKATHPEIKTLANQIITAQQAEIKTMNDWKAKWAK